MTFAEIIDHANSRGVGQFHVFGDEPFYTGKPLRHTGAHRYQSTWRSFETAKAIARSAEKGRVYNDSGELVFRAA